MARLYIQTLPVYIMINCDHNILQCLIRYVNSLSYAGLDIAKCKASSRAMVHLFRKSDVK